ncbi:MAG: Gfo/Idh/MocA family oxidoreductase [Candidatus Yanofskybacteria bacterium]|nr:Gfo/Idh/MocA family oxidoreductase [Candidatus Yanofskybacteria bacterium]
MIKTIGIIGFGSIGGRHYRNIKKLYPRVKVKILTKRTDLFLKDEIFKSENEFFKNTADVFFITNETYKHADAIIKCLKQKPKGIFVEKPLFHNLKKANEIKKLLSRTPVFFVGYCLQFHKPIIELKKIIKKKIIGRPVFIRASVGQDLRTWRKRDYKKIYSYDAQRGGGVVLDLIHEINYPAWLIDENIKFKAGLVKRAGMFNIKSEDIAEGVFESKTGTVVSIHQDYLRYPGRRYCEIIGDKGTATWDSLKNEIAVRLPKRESFINVKVDGNKMYLNELSFFIKKVLKRVKHSNFNEALGDLKNALALKQNNV